MALSVSTSPLAQDIEDIIYQEGPYSELFLVGSVLHTDEKDLDEENGIIFYEANVSRDYRAPQGGQGALTDYIEINLLVNVGTYIYDIYPYADNLELTLIRTKQHRFSGYRGVVDEERYKAIFLLEKNSNLPTQGNASRDQLNREPPLALTLQLMDRAAMALRLKPISGVVSSSVEDENVDMAPDAIAKSLLSRGLKEIEVDGKPAVDVVEVEKGQNTTPLKRVTIPSGTHLANLPIYLQENAGGIYTAGIGSYLQKFMDAPDAKMKKTFFVYSLYTGMKYHNNINKTIFYIPPSGSHNNVARTYKLEANVLRIFANPIQGLSSTKDAVLRSEGEGFRTANQESMLSKPYVVTEDGPEYKRGSLMTEVTTRERKDGLVNAPLKGVSGNHMVNTSEVLARVGSYVKLVVDNLDPDYIPPAGACRIVYESSNGLIEELLGVVHTVSIRYYYQKFDFSLERGKKTHGVTSRVIFDVYITGTDGIS